MYVNVVTTLDNYGKPILQRISMEQFTQMLEQGAKFLMVEFDYEGNAHSEPRNQN